MLHVYCERVETLLPGLVLPDISRFVVEVGLFRWEKLGGVAAIVAVAVGGRHFFEEVGFGGGLACFWSDIDLLFGVGIEKSVQFFLLPVVVVHTLDRLSFNSDALAGMSVELGNGVFEAVDDVLGVCTLGFLLLGEEVGHSRFVVVIV